jgi:hypothetical protein
VIRNGIQEDLVITGLLKSEWASANHQKNTGL